MRLFDHDPEFPPGFTYIPDFISIEEENLLIGLVKQVPLKNMQFQGFEARRLVASFGYDFHFGTRKITEGRTIPAAFLPIIEKTARRIGMPPANFAELLLTEYPAGSVINWHRDAPPFDLIAGISLLSDCIFKLRPHDKARQSRAAVISFPVQRRSLYIMQGPAREDWQHSISPVKQKRYSITLRTLRQHG